MDENELRQTIDAMGRTIERDAKRIAALKTELRDALAYAQALRTATEMLIDALTREKSPSVLTGAIVEEAKQVVAGKMRWGV